LNYLAVAAVQWSCIAATHLSGHDKNAIVWFTVVKSNIAIAMSRSLYHPYKPTNPRTVRGAKKRGWIAVGPNPNYVEQSSWMGLCIWAERASAGYWVASFALREFVFEKPSDAMMFKLKWG
jgi:hypothetical protein